MQNYCPKCNNPLKFIAFIEDPEENEFKNLFYCNKCEIYKFIAADFIENN